MDNLIKICGLSTPETLDVALGAGADLVGFVRFPKSPRHVSLDSATVSPCRRRAGRSASFCWSIPATRTSPQAIEAIDPDLLQLHGSETPERVAEIRAAVGRPVMKAIGIAEPSRSRRR